MAARCDQSSYQNQYHLHHKKYQRVVTPFTAVELIRDGALKSAGGDSLTGNGLNPHPSDACLTATQQLPASRDTTSDRKSTLPLDANVGQTCFFCSQSYIKNHLLTSYSAQIGSDLGVCCRSCFVSCGSVIFCESASNRNKI